MTNSRLVYCYDPDSKSAPYFTALDTTENVDDNNLNAIKMRQTPFTFREFGVNEKLSFFIQSIIINSIEFTRILVVDTTTQKSIATLSGLENNTGAYCEVGALTAFVGMSDAEFYYINPNNFNIDIMLASMPSLKLHSEAYHHQSELFVTILAEYRKEYIRDDLYSKQLLCDWINWSINNIKNHVGWAPINQFSSDNGDVVTTTKTVIINEPGKGKNIATYAAIAARPSNITQQPKTTSQKKPEVAASIVFKPIEQPNSQTKIETNTTVVVEDSKIIKPIAKKPERILYSPTTVTRKSPNNYDQNITKKNSFSPSLFDISSDDESDNESKKQERSLSAQSGNKNNNVGRKGSKKLSSKAKKLDYDEEKFWNNLPSAVEQKTPTDLTAVDAEIINNSKAAVRREEALSVIIPSFAFMCVTPPILNMLGRIIQQTKYDMQANEGSVLKQVTFAAFCTIYTSQVFCAFYATKMLKDSAKQYVKNQPQLNSMLYGYSAAKLSNPTSSVAVIEDKKTKPDYVSKKKHKA